MPEIMAAACRGCGALGGEACRLPAAWDPPSGVCDRQAAQVAAEAPVPAGARHRLPVNARARLAVVESKLTHVVAELEAFEAVGSPTLGLDVTVAAALADVRALIDELEDGGT